MKDVFNVLIVGCGQLGSRHLQSLAKFEKKLNIFIQDPWEPSLTNARTLFEQSAGTTDRFQLKTLRSLNEINSTHMDMIIVANSSLQRLGVIESIILENIKFGIMILEKVLFPAVSQYERALTLLKGQNVYVNCARRMFPVMHYFKGLLNPDNLKNAQFSYSGQNWGLGCNSIHLIDIVSYFTNSLPLSVDYSRLENEIIQSKRTGYIEFLGTLEVYFEDGSKLLLNSSSDEKPHILTIKAGAVNIESNESSKEFKLFNDSKLIETKSFDIPYQSQMTLDLFNKFLSQQTIDLPSFEQSVKIHLPLIKAFTEFYQQVTNTKSEIVPIT